jgi:hypothetical protein
MSIFYTSGLNRQYSIQVVKHVNILYKWLKMLTPPTLQIQSCYSLIDILTTWTNYWHSYHFYKLFRLASCTLQFWQNLTKISFQGRIFNYFCVFLYIWHVGFHVFCVSHIVYKQVHSAYEYSITSGMSTADNNVWSLHFKLEVLMWRHVVYVPKF